MMRNCRQTTFPWTAASSLNRALRTSGEKIVCLNCPNIESFDPQNGLVKLCLLWRPRHKKKPAQKRAPRIFGVKNYFLRFLGSRNRVRTMKAAPLPFAPLVPPRQPPSL